MVKPRVLGAVGFALVVALASAGCDREASDKTSATAAVAQRNAAEKMADAVGREKVALEELRRQITANQASLNEMVGKQSAYQTRAEQAEQEVAQAERKLAGERQRLERGAALLRAAAGGAASTRPVDEADAKAVKEYSGGADQLRADIRTVKVRYEGQARALDRLRARAALNKRIAEQLSQKLPLAKQAIAEAVTQYDLLEAEIQDMRELQKVRDEARGDAGDLGQDRFQAMLDRAKKLRDEVQVGTASAEAQLDAANDLVAAGSDNPDALDERLGTKDAQGDQLLDDLADLGIK